MNERITIDPNIQHGKPVIRGTRVPVMRLAGSFISGMTISEITNAYRVSEADVVSAIIYYKINNMNSLVEESLEIDEGEWIEFRL